MARIYTEYDEQGRSWAVIENFSANNIAENKTEYVGGIPDVWKRR